MTTTKDPSTSSKQTLSLSMIIKNEEAFLEGCLQSVHGTVDEIVIVDTGSTDSSKEIARRYGAKLVDFAWVGDFSAARNHSLGHCTGDWILYLDADERLAAGQEGLLRQLISTKAVGAFNVLINNPHSLRHGNITQENAYPRLFRRLPGVQFEGKVHEQLWPSLIEQKLLIKQSDLIIHHLGYNQGYDVVRQKAERNLELLQSQLAENPDDSYAQFQIGNSLVVLQRYDEARTVLESAVTNHRLDKSNRASACNLLAEVEVNRKNFQGAIQCCLKSLDLAPKQIMAHWFLSLLYFDLKEYDRSIEALKSVERLLRIAPAQRANQLASDLELQASDLHKRFALTYEAADNYGSALTHAMHALEKQPQEKECLEIALRAAEKLDDSRMVIKQISTFLSKRPERKELFFSLAYHYRKVNDFEAAIRYLDQTLQSETLHPRALAFSVQWRMESGDLSGAETALGQAESQGICSFELHKCGLQISLQRGDVNSAFRHLDKMTQTTDADLTPLKNRIAALAAKMSISQFP